MTNILAIICVALLIAVAVFLFLNKRLSRLVAQRDSDVLAAKQQTVNAIQECEVEMTRVRKETEQSLAEAQKLLDQQIADMRVESARVREHYEAESRKVAEATQAQLAKANADAENLRRYAPLHDAEQEVRQTLENAIKEAEALRVQAQTLLDQSRASADIDRLRATEQAKAIYEQADARLNQATRDAGRIIAGAEKRAQEIAGEAHDALRDKQILERAAEAMRNIVEGYGNRYIVPTHSLLDDLAVEFGYTSAGEALKSARAQSRRLVEQNEASTCDYVETYRRVTANRFVTDAFNGRVDAVLSRVKHDNVGVLEQEIRDAFNLVNLNGKAFKDARILEVYLNARIDELKWAATVQELARKQLDEQRELKARMRDEEKARKEYEAQMRQAAKEEEIKKKAVEAMASELAAAQLALEHASAQDKSQLERKIAAMQQTNESLQQELDAATAKTLTIAQQTKKGHVYIISNIGAFGDGVYKIGQTRRLNRQDRIDELGDASVPFDFDVHAWIESENAPALEHRVQKRFLAMQVNKMNSRKEFFRVPLKDIRDEVERLSQTESFTIIHWTDVATAAHYRDSLDIEGDQPKLKKWLERQEALADRDLRLDNLRLTSADVAEPAVQEETP